MSTMHCTSPGLLITTTGVGEGRPCFAATNACGMQQHGIDMACEPALACEPTQKQLIGTTARMCTHRADYSN